MAQLNMLVEETVYRAAKEAARKSGMLLKAWVSRAILEKAEREQPHDRAND